MVSIIKRSRLVTDHLDDNEQTFNSCFVTMGQTELLENVPLSESYTSIISPTVN